MTSIPDWNTKSITKTTSAMHREAVNTTTALFISSERVGQVVWCTSSSYDSLQYFLIFSNIIFAIWHGK